MQLSLSGTEKLLRTSCDYDFLLTLVTVGGKNRRRPITNLVAETYVRPIIYHFVNIGAESRLIG
jgi:hypothetical protein